MNGWVNLGAEVWVSSFHVAMVRPGQEGWSTVVLSTGHYETVKGSPAEVLAVLNNETAVTG